MAGSGEVVDVDVAGPTKTAPEQSKPAPDYVLPVGPVCPFRSMFMEGRNIDNEIGMVAMQAMQYEPEFAKFAQVLSQGLPVDKTKAMSLGVDIVTHSENMRKVLDGMEFAEDFQAAESYYLMDVTSRKKGALSPRNIQEYMRWQGDGLQELASGREMPPPPEVVRAALESEQPPPPPDTPAAPPIRCPPFGAEDFEAISSRDKARFLEAEYERLKRDHKELLGQGESYGSFDARGKESYLDKMDVIAARWEELIQSILSAGASLSPEFVQLNRVYMLRSRCTAAEFRTYVKDTHDFMRSMARQKG